MRIWLGVFRRLDLSLHPVIVVADTETAARAALALVSPNEDPEFVMDVTSALGPHLVTLVALARERAATKDGSGRWRVASPSEVVRVWLGGTPTEACDRCGQPWPTGAPAPVS